MANSRRSSDRRRVAAESESSPAAPVEELRKDIIARLTDAVASGSYHIESLDVADAILAFYDRDEGAAEG